MRIIELSWLPASLVFRTSGEHVDRQIAMVKRNKEKNLHCIWSGDLVPVPVCIMYIDRIKFEFSYILCNSLLSAY